MHHYRHLFKFTQSERMYTTFMFLCRMNSYNILKIYRTKALSKLANIPLYICALKFQIKSFLFTKQNLRSSYNHVIAIVVVVAVVLSRPASCQFYLES